MDNNLSSTYTIKMVDLQRQYDRIKSEVDSAIANIMEETNFVNGNQVKKFSSNLAGYSGSKHVITCGNGTDALQIALMALDLDKGDEIIVPSFSYGAHVEAIILLGFTPVFVDVDYDSFNITIDNIKRGLTSRTKAIIPVHLFGQCCDMQPIMEFAAENELFVIEDNAQSLGTQYLYNNKKVYSGTIGHIGCNSFFPSKNLGCFGDGGALMTNNDVLAERIRMIANHGQKIKYNYEILGCNSRLDTMQAAVLDVKLNYLNQYCSARNNAAQYYNNGLNNVDDIELPEQMSYSTHSFHQYTIKVKNNRRDKLRAFLKEAGIPSMVYYPSPLHRQKAFNSKSLIKENPAVSEQLCGRVLSLPIHTEITREEQDYIIHKIHNFFK